MFKDLRRIYLFKSGPNTIEVRLLYLNEAIKVVYSSSSRLKCLGVQEYLIDQWRRFIIGEHSAKDI